MTENLKENYIQWVLTTPSLYYIKTVTIDDGCIIYFRAANDRKKVISISVRNLLWFNVPLKHPLIKVSILNDRRIDINCASDNYTEKTDVLHSFLISSARSEKLIRDFAEKQTTWHISTHNKNCNFNEILKISKEIDKDFIQTWFAGQP